MGTDRQINLKEQNVTNTHGISSPKRQQQITLPKRLLTVKEASVYLGRSVPSIRELIWAGKLPIVREGKRIHLDIFDLDRWIEQRKTTYTY